MKLDDQQSMEPIQEVLLTARDLRQLDPAISAALGVTSDIGEPAGASRVAASGVAKVPSDHRLTVIGIVSVGIITTIALGAHYAYSRPEPEAPVVKQTWTALPEKPQIVVEEELPPPPKHTLYRNPFDKSEVFELPPGLTQAEARDMVAQILLDRARERAR